jgi:DNA (cytosine-5)-methyltransferase 1
MGRQDWESETLIPTIGGDFDVTHSLRADGFDASEDGTGRGTPLVAVPHCDVMPTMMNGANTPAGHNARSGHSKDSYIVPVAFGWQNSSQQGASASASATPTLDKSKVPGIGIGSAVRRLTPMECERLQGFADGYTAVTFRGKPASDGPRYKALGNSMAVPCMAWLGHRIQSVHSIKGSP